MYFDTVRRHLLLVPLMVGCVAGNARAQEETEFSFTAALAPHFATGSANLNDKEYLFGGTGFLDLHYHDNLTAFFQSQPQYPGDGSRCPQPSGTTGVGPGFR